MTMRDLQKHERQAIRLYLRVLIERSAYNQRKPKQKDAWLAIFLDKTKAAFDHIELSDHELKRVTRQEMATRYGTLPAWITD